jgi:hypothetical protein
MNHRCFTPGQLAAVNVGSLGLIFCVGCGPTGMGDPLIVVAEPDALVSEAERDMQTRASPDVPRYDAGMPGVDQAPDQAGRTPDAGVSDGGWTRDEGQPPDEPPFQPGDVDWIVFSAQHARSSSAWGDVLNDIVQHCPEESVDYYSDSDRVTHGHETSHAIHSYLRNHRNETGERANGFYVLGDRAALVREPGIRKSQVGEFVPQILRRSRFSTYVTGQSAWDDTPLYIWDEWNAYVNGTEVAMDLAQSGGWTFGWRDACMGTLEFVTYAVAVGLAVEKHDPIYLVDHPQFMAFLAWNVDRSMTLYEPCAQIADFAWDEQDDLYVTLRDHPDSATIRDFLRRALGDALFDNHF